MWNRGGDPDISRFFSTVGDDPRGFSSSRVTVGGASLTVRRSSRATSDLMVVVLVSFLC